MTINCTMHAARRCGHRGFRDSDLGLIAEYGTMTDGGFLLTRRDIQEAERLCKRLIDRLSKLQDAFVPTSADGNTAKTVFRATRRQRRQQTGQW